jgi:hypothetical protein
VKSVYQIAKENNVNAITLYKRILARKVKTHLIKGVMMLDEEQEQEILIYSKRGRKNAQNKKTSDQKE